MTERATSTEFSLGSALRAIRRRAPVVLLVAVVVPAVALVLSLVQSERYTATASLLFRDAGLDQTLFGSSLLPPASDPDREAATNVRLVSLDAIAERTARAIQPSMSPESVADNIEVEAEGQSDVVSVRATSPSAPSAARLANEFAEQYIGFRRDADRSKVREAEQLVERQLASLSPTERSGARGRSLRERAEELQILASLQTGNAELVQRAGVPKSPSYPTPVKNTVFGALVGLLLGVLVALVAERLDRRLRDPTEIEEIYERPTLAVIPVSRALSEGGPAGHVLTAGVEEAFRMLRANLRYFNVDSPVRSVLVTSAAKGDGKSTVAWNLARAAAAAGELVLLIEADLRQPSLAASNAGLRPAPGLSTVLAGDVVVDDAVQRIPAAHTHAPGAERTIDVLVGGPLPPNPVDLIESERMRNLLQAAQAQYGLVVIDTPPTSVVSDAIPLVKGVSGTIVVARIGKSTRESSMRLHRQLDNLGAPLLGLVINGAKAEGGTGYYGYEYAAPEGRRVAKVEA